jgi:hypothetical protein
VTTYLSGQEAAQVGEFLRGLDALVLKTGVHFSTINPWLEINHRDIGELAWEYVPAQTIEHRLRKHNS